MIESVFEKHKSRLMAIRGVVGVGIGKYEGKPCIKVYIAKKTDKLLGQIPSNLEGYRVGTEETGEIHALGT